MGKKLPLWIKIVYGVPQAGIFLTDQIVIAWVFYFFTTGALDGSALVPPAIVGGIFFFGRVVDAVADPVIARFSDNFDSPWGRRIPFMAVSGVLKIIIFIALFHPLLYEETIWNGVYLAVLLFFYFIFFTAYVCPYLALIPALAPTNSERVDLSTFKAAFGMLGAGGALIGSGIMIEIYGFQGMAWIMGLLALVLLYVPMFIREKEFSQSEPATFGLIEAVKNTLQNRPFIFYLVGCVSFWFGGNIVMLSLPFYVTVLLGEGEATTSLFFGAAGALAAIAFPFINLYSKKWGLKAMMMFSMLILTIILPAAFFMGQPLWGIDPLIIALVAVSIAGIPIAILFIVPDALVASISDFDEKNTGQRREAMYFGIQGLVMKIAFGLSSALMGGLFQLYGQTPEQPLGVQLTGPVAAVFVLIGLIIFSRYPEKEVVACQKAEAGIEEESLGA